MSDDVIDYKALLRKYMQHILDMEGITFVTYAPEGDVTFTALEMAALQNMHDEVCDEQ